MKKIISFVIFLAIFTVAFVGLSSLSPQKAQAQNVGSLKNIVTPGFSFTMDMALGDTDQDVLELQKVLNADVDTVVALEGPGSIGNETKYFGPATKVAVTKFQNKYKDVVLTLNGITTANGLVDKPTRTRLNLLLGVMVTNNSVGSPESRANITTAPATVAYVAPAIITPTYTNTGNSLSVCQFVELMIAIGVVPSNKINSSREALNCSNNDDEVDDPTRPTVNLTINDSSTSVTVAKGASVTLRWTTARASSCTASWGTNLGTAGSKILTANSSGSYTLTCTGSNSLSTSDTVRVTVTTTNNLVASTTSSSIWAWTRISNIRKNIISILTSTTTERAGPTPTSGGAPGFPSIGTDSKNQPHILVKGEGNSGLYAYNKIGSAWIRSVPLVIKPGGPGNPDLEIDDRDNAWISGNTVVQTTAPTMASCQAAIEEGDGAFAGTWSVFHDCVNGDGGDSVMGGALVGGGAGAAGLAGAAVVYSTPIGAAALGGVLLGSAVGAIGGSFLGDEKSNAGKIFAIQFQGVPECEGLTGLIGLTQGNIEAAVERGLAEAGATGGVILGQADMGSLSCGVESTPQRQANVQAIIDSGQYVILGKPIEGNWAAGDDALPEEPEVVDAPSPTGNWVGFIANSTTKTALNWFNKVMHKHFVGNLSVDPFSPGKAFFMGSQPDPVIEFDATGQQNIINTMSPGKSGEKIIFEIAPIQSTSTTMITRIINGVSSTTATTTINLQEGIWHAASGGYNSEPGGYINSNLGSRVPWAGTNYANAAGDDGAYVSLGIDWKNPEAAYIASSYKGVVINIWDGDKMMFPANSLHVIDSNPATFGNGIRRFAPQWTPAQGGGAFLCWTGSDGNIKMKYITTEGTAKFGPTVNVAKGSQCAMSTDTKGDVDLTYIVGSTVEYKKIRTATSTTP